MLFAVLLSGEHDAASAAEHIFGVAPGLVGRGFNTSTYAEFYLTIGVLMAVVAVAGFKLLSGGKRPD